METQVTILAKRLPEASKMLGKFGKKAERYNVPFTYSFSDVRTEDRERVRGSYETVENWKKNKTYQVKVIDVTITGERPTVGKYDFLASVEFAKTGNIVDAVPGVDVPKSFRTTKGFCDHCKVNRYRKHGFVVKNRDTGEIVQIGRTCLRDFLGTGDPHQIIHRFQFNQEIDKWSEEESGYGFGNGKYYEEAREVIGVGLAAVRAFSWVSAKAWEDDPSAVTTAERFGLYKDITSPKSETDAREKLIAEIKPEDFLEADEIIKWVRGLEAGENDYLWNLKIALEDDVIDPRRLSLVISAVVAWANHQEREIKRAKQADKDADSVYLGDVGQRLRSLPVTVEMIRGLGQNQWGWSHLVKFRTAEGSILTWISSAVPEDVETGVGFVIDGTVKAHKEFRGAKETTLTRVRVKAS